MSNLATLRPFPKGISPNPGGRPKSAQYKRAVAAVMLAKAEIAKGGKAPRLKILLEAAYEKALTQLRSSPTGLNDVMPFLIMLRDTLDGKNVPGTEVEAKKSSVVYLSGGEVTKCEEVQSVTETVRLETGEDSNGNADN